MSQNKIVINCKLEFDFSSAKKRGLRIRTKQDATNLIAKLQEDCGGNYPQASSILYRDYGIKSTIVV